MFLNSPYRIIDGKNMVVVTEQQQYLSMHLYDDFRILTKELTLAGYVGRLKKYDRLKLAINLLIEELRRERRDT